MGEIVRSYYRKVVADFWDQKTVVILLGILSGLYFGAVGVVWAVTGEFTRWGASFLKLIGVDLSPYTYLKIIKYKGTILTRIDGVMVLGMFAGALIAALFGQNFKLRIPTAKRVIQALVGGIIAGFGTRLAMGCNLAALFTGIPQFSLHTWFFTLGTIFGTYIGIKITLSPYFRGEPKLVKASEFNAGNLKANTQIQPFLGWLGLIVFAGILLSRPEMPNILKLATIFGFAFGFLIQKGQVCFTSAFRDLWLVGRTTTLKALVWGMAVQMLLTAVFIAKGTPAKVLWAGPNALIGGLLFGIGIVIAGGCETGWMYRSMEGQVHFWFVGLGNVIGATLLFLLWDKGLYKYLVEPFPKFSLIEHFGYLPAIILTGLFLLGLYLWADLRELSGRSMIKNKTMAVRRV
ncbi:hypothetical protein ciss_08410 [Carboxydothermus islandicus]|uniref:YeeE/YedE family protein n=1 Tax=Carboxydothermus islandicus TaxID=661089 RepID=A0A1L8D176_9THEO|nr:selenium metabolism membrane protein YedE/FdhT [Carboxydothermus islandicus]GAV24908.1 hypothetical protein ciss_08410 [Carboxydothermus islandicus]